MIYGVCVVHNPDDYKDMEIQIWVGSNANLFFNKGCEAVFICEPAAQSYAYEQAEIRKIKYNRKVISVSE